MPKSPPAALRTTLYVLRGGFLIRPFVIAFLLGAAGVVLSAIEEPHLAIQAIVGFACRPANVTRAHAPEGQPNDCKHPLLLASCLRSSP